MNFENKNILIIGSNADLVRPLASEFAKAKTVLLTYNNKKNNIDRLNISSNTIIHNLKLDLNNLEEVRNFLKENKINFEIIIIAAGVTDEQLAMFDDSDIETINNVNYLSNSMLVEHFSSIAAKYNHKLDIICISSISGIRGRNKNIFYSASKSALNSLTSSLRQKYAHSSVNIFTVIPGYLDTRMIKNEKPNKLLVVSPKDFWKAVFKGIKKKKNIIYPNLIWRIISFIIVHIPEKIFIRLKF